MKIAILGAAGRMGRKLCELAPGAGLEVVSRVDIADGFDREWSADAEGVIDFSYHAAVPPARMRASAGMCFDRRASASSGVLSPKSSGVAAQSMSTTTAA